MSKWKHPYIIRIGSDKKQPFQLMALAARTRHEPHYYRFVESYYTIEKALKAKRKAYARLY